MKKHKAAPPPSHSLNRPARPPLPDDTAAPDVVAAFGATGSGKSRYMHQLIAGESRLMVFDSMQEYGRHGIAQVRTLREFGAAVERAAFRVAFVPSSGRKKRVEEFEKICDAAFSLGDVCLVVEELRFVTRPQWAPEAWARVTGDGRHMRLKVRATSQRPASIDKDFFGNCTRIRCGRLVEKNDALTMAEIMRVTTEQLRDLAPLQYFERDLAASTTTRGALNPGPPL